MAPLGWKWAAFVWAYALIWFLVNDRFKLLALPHPGSGKESAGSLPHPLLGRRLADALAVTCDSCAIASVSLVFQRCVCQMASTGILGT